MKIIKKTNTYRITKQDTIDGVSVLDHLVNNVEYPIIINVERRQFFLFIRYWKTVKSYQTWENPRYEQDSVRSGIRNAENYIKSVNGYMIDNLYTND